MLVTFNFNMLPEESESHSSVPVQTSVLESIHAPKRETPKLSRKFCGLE